MSVPSVTYDHKTTCQVDGCGLVFDTPLDKQVHVSVAHDIGRGRGATERVRRFTACPCGSARVFVGEACPDCGTVNVAPAWRDG